METKEYAALLVDGDIRILEVNNSVRVMFKHPYAMAENGIICLIQSMVGTQPEVIAAALNVLKEQEEAAKAKELAARKEKQAARTKNGKVYKYVSLYFHRYMYGGPEEGGWYYHTTELVQYQHVPLKRVKFWKKKYEAMAEEKTANCAKHFWTRYDYFSVIIENDLAEHENTAAPRYE